MYSRCRNTTGDVLKEDQCIQHGNMSGSHKSLRHSVTKDKLRAPAFEGSCSLNKVTLASLKLNLISKFQHTTFTNGTGRTEGVQWKGFLTDFIGERVDIQISKSEMESLERGQTSIDNYWQLDFLACSCPLPISKLQSSSFGSQDTPRRCRHSLHSQRTHSTHSRWTPGCKSRALSRKKLLAYSNLKKGSTKKNKSSKWIKIIQNHFAKINLFS